MPSDEQIMYTWDMVERLSIEASVDIDETEHGLDFKNYLGDVIANIPIAGSE